MPVPLSPRSHPRDIRVLKSSDKYLIASCDEDGGRCVYKVAHVNPEKLDREVGRIRALAAAYPSLRDRLPAILASGSVTAGTHAGKRYYVQRYLPGDTFSHHIQSAFADEEALQSAFSTIMRVLLDIAAEHTYDPAYDGGSGSFLRERITIEHERVRSLAHIAPLLAWDDLTIDGQRYASLSRVFDGLFASRRFAGLDHRPSSIASLGHWNFHGDNILLPSLGDSAGCKVIDPDVSIDACDPLFGIARFLYTFPHDTADYAQYLVHSDMFEIHPPQDMTFRTTHLWPAVVFRNYTQLFGPFLSAETDHLARVDGRLSEPSAIFRLQLCLLWCLLRGVVANYEDVVEFVDGRMATFRHKSIYLFLQAVRYANCLATPVPIATTVTAKAVRAAA